MKKVTAAALAALMLCSGALAMQELPGVALVGEGLIYYAGSLDGKTMGVFAMEADGGNARLLFAGDSAILAGNGETVLICDYDQDAGNDVALLDNKGKELYRLEAQVGSAIESEGRYFLGGHMLSFEDGQASERVLIELAADQQWMVQPVYAKSDTLYYLDSTRYAPLGIEGNTCVGKLVRLNIATGESTLISPEGTDFIGMWEGRAVYMRRDFYIYEDDDTRVIETGEGLYIEGESGGETLLAPIDDRDETITTYSLLDEGVVYGDTVDYGQDQPTASLRRVKLNGETPGDLPMPVASLCAAAEGKLYLCASNFVEDGFYQEDHIIRMDPETGACERLNQGRAEVLCYSESDPSFAIQNGRIYYLDFEGSTSAVRLCAIDMDGANYAVLARGYEWENVE